MVSDVILPDLRQSWAILKLMGCDFIAFYWSRGHGCGPRCVCVAASEGGTTVNASTKQTLIDGNSSRRSSPFRQKLEACNMRLCMYFFSLLWQQRAASPFKVY
ncbi:hypothetical protein ILYODFUR_011921 [Ilyodon furcidens]|uniref:Uncharacterized protein n=1 Tax=Ilyodon furcidens TaxID=33524 RepID=A0ABV0U4N4_9TELE